MVSLSFVSKAIWRSCSCLVLFLALPFPVPLEGVASSPEGLSESLVLGSSAGVFLDAAFFAVAFVAVSLFFLPDALATAALTVWRFSARVDFGAMLRKNSL